MNGAGGQKALVREIAAQHGVALDQDDPILILQTATHKIVQDALEQASQAQLAALAQHRSELEVIAAKSASDLSAAASRFAAEVRAAARAAIEQAMSDATTVAVARLRTACGQSERRSARSAVVAAAAAAAALLSLTTALLFRVLRLL